MSDIVEEEQPAVPAAAEPKRGEPVYFNGDVPTVCKMVFKYALLTLVTLGIYRFWAKTKLRRYFWSQTEFDGDRFEYHGTPKELFIGFLIVIAILAPIYFVLEVTGNFIATEGFVPLMIYQFVYIMAFLILIQIAVYRMSRYRLTRTSWRGVRFGLDGNTWRYTGMSLVAIAVCIVSIGIAYPWMRNWLVRYRIENMRFGEKYFSYNGQPMMLAKRWWISLGVCLAPFVIAVIVSGIPTMADFETMNRLSQGQQADGAELPAVFEAYLVAYLFTSLAATIMFIWYRVGEFRLVVSKTSLHEATMDSSLSTGRIYGLVALLVGLFVVLFGILAGSMFTLTNLELSPVFGIVLGVVLFVVVFTAFTVIPTGLYGTLQARAVLTSIHVYNKQSLTDIAQGDQSQMKYGEGLADAFDVGAF